MEAYSWCDEADPRTGREWSSGAPIAAALARLARELAAEPDVESVLQRVVAAAIREVPGAAHAGVTVMTRDGAVTPAATDGLVCRVDAVQYESGQGPCLEAAAERPVVRADDLRTDDRWPEFAPRAAELGVGSMLSFQMFVHSGAVGALNLYGTEPNAFPPGAEDIGGPLAAHAAVAMTATRTEANLRVALDSRDLVGQAKGILMERYKIDAQQAFDLLIASSQATNVKLREVADRLTRTGELMTPRRRRD